MIGAPAFCIEGERIHFLHEADLEVALLHGYLELWLVNDGGVLNRIIRYQPESGAYLWYEAQEGMAPSAKQSKTYTRIEDLLGEHDVHAYKWYPIFPSSSSSSSSSSMVARGGGGGFTPFNYHKLISKGVPCAAEEEEPYWGPMYST